MYYQNKLDTLRDLFGTPDIELQANSLRVGSVHYPIHDDVILLSSPHPHEFAEDIQFTFGEEWKTYDRILPEHQQEFLRYFDLIPPGSLTQARVCDLGCGNGRWSFLIKDSCREVVLVDFSDAIFVARRNLKGTDKALFFRGDLKSLPFREGFADFLFCLGVLHHLPTPCLEEVRALRRWAPKNLVFLYYALDNRPFYFRLLLAMVTGLRLLLCRIRNQTLRKIISHLGTVGVYYPLILLGKILRPLGLSRHVPLYDFYHDKSYRRIEQDVYDRFFTRIEQRVSRQDILKLKDTFSKVTVSDQFPYWHFLCEQ
ncbi:MAG: class I SAM-dependent methyltransferase [Elusimicrobiota bacterium]|jgi:SAM-dependent methyltransferase